ncbi:MAG TPA: hypothetical protein VGG39_33090 [Polyangiaceae bacterium]|jgi:hypothetical protein
MNRNVWKLSKVLLASSAAGALGAVLLLAAPAEAQWVPPPAEYIATTEPVYYEGHAAYWYGDHWYWRDVHGAWQHYDHEPAALADRRAHWGTTGQTRWSYGHGRPYHR